MGPAGNLAVAVISSELGANRRVLAALETDCRGPEENNQGTKEPILVIQEAHGGGRARVTGCR